MYVYVCTHTLIKLQFTGINDIKPLRFVLCVSFLYFSFSLTYFQAYPTDISLETFLKANFIDLLRSLS